jgi:DNA-directed RNA polymerase sigma subunit (sigma70/sigma32)
MVEARARLARARRALEARGAATPDVGMLAKATGLPETKVALAEGLPSTRLSIDLPMDREDGTCFKDMLEASNDDDPVERGTTERIRQLQEQALAKIRSQMLPLEAEHGASQGPSPDSVRTLPKARPWRHKLARGTK